MEVAMMGHGTLNEINADAWLPTSPFFWRKCVTIHACRFTRPDIVSDMRILQLDLPRERFDAVLTLYVGASPLLDDGRVCASFLANVHGMLKPGGVFVLSPSKCLRRTLEKLYAGRSKRPLSGLSDDITAAEPRFKPVPASSYRSAFSNPFVQAFFATHEREDALAKLADALGHKESDILMFRTACQ